MSRTREAIWAVVVVISLVACAPREAALPSASVPTAEPTPTVTATPTARPHPELTSTAPVARGYHAVVSVGARGVWLFGGGTDTPALGYTLNDSWTYRRSTGWVRAGLAERQGPSDVVAFDAKSGKSIALPESGDGDTLLYDFAGARWESRPFGQRPAGLWGARAVYDSKRDRILLLTENGETWTYDVNGEAWTNKEPRSSPPGRRWFGMVYDERADRVLIFGGHGYGDMWAYDANVNAWKELTPTTRPPARQYTAMTYEPKSGRTILFGGGGGMTGEEPLGDTWSYDFATNSWRELSPPSAPSPRGWHAMGYESESGLIVLFGGGPDRHHFQSDTWLYDPARNVWSSQP